MSSACASGAPHARDPAYYRSPTRDYQQPAMEANGYVLGADDQAMDDWILAGATNEHGAVGWVERFGVRYFDREHARGGYGTFREQAACAAPLHGPPSPEERAARAALLRAWGTANRPPAVVAALGEEPPELPFVESDWLGCGD